MKFQTISATDINVVSKKQFKLVNWLLTENAFFTVLMEEKITNLQFILLFNAVMSFGILVGCAFINAIAAVISLLYFVMSIHICKKGGLK